METEEEECFIQTWQEIDAAIVTAPLRITIKNFFFFFFIIILKQQKENNSSERRSPLRKKRVKTGVYSRVHVDTHTHTHTGVYRTAP